jgi:hypothetical protein
MPKILDFDSIRTYCLDESKKLNTRWNKYIKFLKKISKKILPEINEEMRSILPEW